MVAVTAAVDRPQAQASNCLVRRSLTATMAPATNIARSKYQAIPWPNSGVPNQDIIGTAAMPAVAKPQSARAAGSKTNGCQSARVAVRSPPATAIAKPMAVSAATPCRAAMTGSLLYQIPV